MKRWYQFAAVFMSLLLLVSLSACTSESGNETTAPVESTTEAVQIDPMALYDAACAALSGKTNVVIRFDGTQKRVVGGETYTEAAEGTASYAGRGTEDMTALISETLSFGTYEAQYIQSYISGCGYCRVNNNSFRCDMTADEFTADRLPAVLLDSALYGSITAETDGERTQLSFTDPLALESWMGVSDAAEITSAHGTMTLDANGTITAASYHAEYAISTAAYTVDLSITVETPASLDLSASQPVYPEDCTTINNLHIPRILMQVVGDVYTAESMSVSYTDRVYSEAFAVVRQQSGSFDTHGSGSDFLCSMTTQVALTDYTGTTSTNSQSISYLDGIYSCATNGGEPTTADNITAEQVRTSCEDSILSSLFVLDCIAAADLTDTGDFLCIQFTGNDAYTDGMFDGIYTLFGMDLDSYAQSYSTAASGGYLVINKYTLLPTALGMNVSRSHVIDDVSYQLTYQLDQAMELSSKSAYENITGQAPEESVPAQTATPLFYKVTGENGETMWLLGTIHVGDERTAYLPQQITDAFNGADALAVEFNTITYEDTLLSDASLQAQLAEAYYYSDGTTISNHLSADLYAQIAPLILACGKNSASAPYMKVSLWNDVIDNFYLLQGTSLTAEQGMDSRLLRMAAAQEKTVYEIESFLSQIQMFTGFSDKLQAHLLEESFAAGLIGYCDGVNELYELWCQGDEAALTAYLATDSTGLSEDDQALYEEYNAAMYTNRNAAMLTAAKAYLESGETVFYAVGLAHLLGEDGLVETLRAAGYTVEPVSYSK